MTDTSSRFETLVNPPQEIFDQLLKWSGETEGWSFQATDYDFWRDAYDGYWFFAVIEKESNSFVASVSLALLAPENEEPLYSIGMYYCRPEFRGNGQALEIFRKALAIVGDHNLTLWGVVDLSPKYASKFGLDKVNDCWHMCTTIKMIHVNLDVPISDEYQTKGLNEVDRQKVHEFDRTVCPKTRNRLMDRWFQCPQSYTKVVFDKASGNIVGYTTIRIMLKRKLSVGPMYAMNKAAASRLFHDVLVEIPEWRMHDDICFLHAASNADVTDLVSEYSGGRFESKEFMRGQYTKQFIPIPHQYVYSISDCAHAIV
ncbi:unnamed protein product [Caenorhabditis auriculariae]|uniref:N-acetyltransferase domain-containing protein n=1 Tax=Caenorhabditis auriculariae TaxID=2777116 RepID=A0A8S1HFW9_9PELO|nr:unnamed protein product [Caenorhabditis auriculariae]